MNKIIILLGPTCVGKTSASISLAKFLDSEIISADSMQIYRHMNIGTAKPYKSEMDGIVHHMIDIVEPTDMFSTGRYVEAVIPIINSILKKGRIPIITGGTGLYMEAITRGFFKAAEADWPLRNNLLEIERERSGSLYQLLFEIDPLSAVKIMSGDIRRIIRAIEVFFENGVGISNLQATGTTSLPYDFIKIGLMRERVELYQRIEKRVDIMIGSGLISEVKELLSLNPTQTPMKAIGYKEIARYFSGLSTMEEAIAEIKQASRRYAKRQISWFKRDKDIIWVDITGVYDKTQIFERVMQSISRFI
ncbi:MAG: tRNA (adenosine(37)-N6)-dimethylallyltransferase MiaA [Nitrospirae bacterium]|nr:tRNA (adenosine(37)-N6)-dimethylallyltransferase MiaA [Nitrospirota bacterium]